MNKSLFPIILENLKNNTFYGKKFASVEAIDSIEEEIIDVGFYDESYVVETTFWYTLSGKRKGISIKESLSTILDFE